MNINSAFNFSDLVKNGVEKLDPQQIFQLATEIIQVYQQTEELKIKGEFFFKAVKEHEKTLRSTIKSHEHNFETIVNAMQKSIDSISDPKLKFESLKLLAEFGGKSIQALGGASEKAFENIPKPPQLRRHD